MNFAEAETYLYALGNEVETMKLGLENIRTLLSALGDPQTKYLKVQVAGTNGKGSVCVFLDSICRSAGVRTGLYTSPHLISITERIRIDGDDIEREAFARYASRVREISKSLVAEGKLQRVPTFFEQATAIALLAFADSRVDLAILETGLGGRLDATTAANAEIAAITRIDLDHQEYLGGTIEEIAAEKAAIVRADSRAVIVGPQSAEAMAVIRSACDDVGIEPTLADRADLDVDENKCLTGVFQTLDRRPISLGLVGRHQMENAGIAICLADALRAYFPISPMNIFEGLERARHPGRLEFQGRYLFDGAHNAGGAKALRAFLDESPDQPITLIFGAMGDKDVYGIANLLFPRAASVILTEVANSRSMPVDTILKRVEKITVTGKLTTTKSVAEALTKAVEISPSDALILITGSLYLVGEAKKILQARFEI